MPSDSAGIRRRHFAIVNGSLGELSAALDLAAVLGAIDADAARTIDGSCERFAMMLRKIDALKETTPRRPRKSAAGFSAYSF